MVLVEVCDFLLVLYTFVGTKKQSSEHKEARFVFDIRIRVCMVSNQFLVRI